MPKVSVIIPVYNVEKYLRECLDSVVNQTLKDIEIICVNDGSTDSSPQILQEYVAKDDRIKIINKPNSGYGASMNMGIEKATGEYIGIVESDDFAELNMYEDLFNLAKENNADMVKSDWYDYYTIPKIKNNKFNAFNKLKVNCIVNTISEPNIFAIQPTIWSALYNRSFLQENKIDFLETPGASYQDASFAFKVNCCAKRIILTDKAYIHYRRDNENSSINSKNKVMAICWEYTEMEKFLDSNPHLDNICRVYKWLNQYYGYNWNLMRITKKYQRSFINKFRQDFEKAYRNNSLGEKFYKELGKGNCKKFEILMNHPNQYYKLLQKKKFKEWRRKLFEFRWNRRWHVIRIFGKTLVENHF